MSEGTIVKWYKKEGDAMEAGDLLCDIQVNSQVSASNVKAVLVTLLLPSVNSLSAASNNSHLILIKTGAPIGVWKWNFPALRGNYDRQTEYSPVRVHYASHASLVTGIEFYLWNKLIFQYSFVPGMGYKAFESNN